MGKFSLDQPIEFQPFTFALDDALATEHRLVSAWVDEAIAKLGDQYYKDLELGELESGQRILAADAGEGRRIAMAALAQVRHWDAEVAHELVKAESDFQRDNIRHRPGWQDVWGPRRHSAAVLDALLRRKLPLTPEDLVALIAWSEETGYFSSFHFPAGAILKAVERDASRAPLSEALRTSVARLADKLAASNDKTFKKLVTKAQQLATAAEQPPPTIDAETATPRRSRPVQAVAGGTPTVLTALKKALGLDGVAPDVPTEAIGYDGFSLRNDSPLRAEHAMISQLIGQVIDAMQYHDADLITVPAGRQILDANDAQRGRLLLAAAERAVASALAPQNLDERLWQSRSAADRAVVSLLRSRLTLDRNGLADLFLFLGTTGRCTSATIDLDPHLAAMERFPAESPLTDGERYALHRFRTSEIPNPQLGKVPPDIARLSKLIGDGLDAFFLVPGEAWTDALNADLAALAPAARERWSKLIAHMLTATSSRPSAKWLKTAADLINAIGRGDVTAAAARWLPQVAAGKSARTFGPFFADLRGGSDTMHDENATALRGLLWLAPTLDAATPGRLILPVAVSAFKKIPGVGPRAPKVGNAAIYALSAMNTPEAVGQLAVLKVRVKSASAQKEIEKAFNAAAAALNLPRDEIEEMGVPTYGLEDVGLRRETFDDGTTGELRVGDDGVELSWLGPDGKPRKSVPASIKANHKEELKELQTAAKDVAAMLPAQAARLDALFLAQRRWPLATWRQRYLDHPLVGTLARRLIWTFTRGPHSIGSGIYHDGQIVDAKDSPLPLDGDAIEVQLWHPIDKPTAEITAWRDWLDRHRVRQPFKQAHREIYPLTDAELHTATYSNRFAAHVLRQHQFNALCGARGWRNKLRLMVDDFYPPASRELPQWGLRAEFWIEGIGDHFGTDTNDSGVFLRVATDQVRFYRTGSAQALAHAGGGGYSTDGYGRGAAVEPLPLHEIPPLVFSEIMRDVDLFVGVASVGNDPAWQDGGPGGRFRAYWEDYSFGALAETAKTRRDVIARLLPRLTKIKDRCSIEDRFLVVRGSLRIYKIHLGSGNILMEPNDQYLCIVPDRSTALGGRDVFLPFEGDATLAVILSKAFLLADDAKIKDPTIVRQINHR